MDTEISKRTFKTFLKSLDPMKRYFYAHDIATLKTQESQLADQIKRGDTSFAYNAYNLLLQRIDERQAMIDQLIKEPIDFTINEEMATDPDKYDYAVSDDDMRDRWRKWIKYDNLVLRADKTSDADIKDKLSRRYKAYASRMHHNSNVDLMEIYLSALTTSFDPHTVYWSPDTTENFRIQMKLELEGIGAVLQSEDGYTTIKELVPGGAAEKSGELKPKDRVVGVGQGTSGEIVDTVDMGLNEVVKLIRGEKGTIVRLKVIPVGKSESKIYPITRASIELKDEEARSQIFEQGKKPNGQPYKLGVIVLPSFYMDSDGARRGLEDYRSTTRDVRKLLEDFKAKGVDAVVLDLRKNGGGSLDEAISLTGLFIDYGPVVQVKGFDGRVQQRDDEDHGTAWDGPLVVLTTKFSASASEILAGAIQDYKRGLIVGDNSTHGKGTVQSLLPLGQVLFAIPDPPEMGAIKITVQQFYRPNGDSTQHRGVLADVVLPSLSQHWEGISESELDYPVAFDHVEPANFRETGSVNSDEIQRLRESSRARVTQSKDFQKIEKDIAHYEGMKKKKKVSLNEKQFLADRAELDVDKEQEKQLEEDKGAGKPVIKKDYYVDEALAITLDYIRLNDKVAAK